MIIDEESYIAHYGIIRRSGRYPWGSGGNVETRSKGFLEWLKGLRAKGLTDKVISESVGMSTTELRAVQTIARNEARAADIAFAQRLKDKGYSNVAIGERMGLNESSVRALLAPGAQDKSNQLTSIANMLKDQVDQKEFVDVGAGVEAHLHISKERLRVAVAMLKEEGYSVHTVKIPQPSGHELAQKVLVGPDVTQRDVFLNRDKIQQINMITNDQGRTFTDPATLKPMSIDAKRVGVVYAEDGGDAADGVIYVRPGVDDISIGNSRYAQVRIQVGEGHYLKGMAVYKDDMPDGVDLLFNTNKSDTGNKFDAFKETTGDPDFPFGTMTRPLVDKPGDPNAKVTSVMNIVNEEGNWSTWSRNISAQALSKQSPKLAKEQLDMTFEARQQELKEIMELTNPTVRKKLLESYAMATDSSAVHLKAAALERQNWHVILPVNDLSPNEIYAPNYKDGERVALIRYPHGGTFEIPELTVNNRHRGARKALGTDSKDAVGIHHSVAERLSGADFDGDTVLVIPNNKGKLASTPALEGLKNFDPRSSYPAYEGMPKLKPSTKQQLMGDVSNLITDMTIRGAPQSDIARAVRHSMVVIDAEKHNLNYKQSAIDNGIKQLKEQYQGGPNAGASTLISRATSELRVPDRKPRPYKDGGPVNKTTGELEFVPTGRTRRDKSGQVVPRLNKTKRLAETNDAHTLSSGTPMEKLYADHSNKLKALANRARLEAINTAPIKASPSAKKTYANEVASLDAKLALVKQNQPIERQAQIITSNIVKARKAANPNITTETIKKIQYQELEKTRSRLGLTARDKNIHITPKEWDAIQAGAISNNKLTQILNKADMDNVKKLATPRPEKLMTSAKTARARTMLANGATRAEVAAQLGVSLTTLDVATIGDGDNDD